MPHVIVEYSGNIEAWGDPARIIHAVHIAPCTSGHLPADAVKTRAVCHGIWHAGTHTDDMKGFVTILIRTRPSREDHVLKMISGLARDAVIRNSLPSPNRTLTVSVEMQVMDPVAVVHATI